MAAAKKPATKPEELNEPSEEKEPSSQSKVKLTMPLWDSKDQRCYSIGDIYLCSEDEAGRLEANSIGVKEHA